MKKQKKYISTRELVIFAMLGALMFCSKFLTDVLPNINLLSVLAVSYTIVYRKKALVPIYIFVILCGLFSGFAVWWIPYLYTWAILWIFAMLIPKDSSDKKIITFSCIICSLYGLLFGTMYTPFQAIAYGMSFQEAIAWWIAGLPFDIIHAVSNLFLALLVLPITKILNRISDL